MRTTLATVTVVAAAIALSCTMLSCSNVSSMHKAYEAGDTAQLNRLLKIVSSPDYPYATRKKAAEVLGEIGEPTAVPVLIGVLAEYDQRTTLKSAAMVSLGKIGDRSAVKPIGRLLDRSLSDPSADLRMSAMPVLAQLGGPETADILINALAYYDLLMLRNEQKAFRGVFTGDETDMEALRDSLRGPMELFGAGALGGGMFGDSSMPRMTMFGTPTQDPSNLQETTPQERALAHSSLVQVGQPASDAISDHLKNKRTTITLKKELLAIVEEITAASGQNPNETGS